MIESSSMEMLSFKENSKSDLLTASKICFFVVVFKQEQNPHILNSFEKRSARKIFASAKH